VDKTLALSSHQSTRLVLYGGPSALRRKDSQPRNSLQLNVPPRTPSRRTLLAHPPPMTRRLKPKRTTMRRPVPITQLPRSIQLLEKTGKLSSIANTLNILRNHGTELSTSTTSLKSTPLPQPGCGLILNTRCAHISITYLARHLTVLSSTSEPLLMTLTGTGQSPVPDLPTAPLMQPAFATPSHTTRVSTPSVTWIAERPLLPQVLVVSSKPGPSCTRELSSLTEATLSQPPKLSLLSIPLR